MQASDTMEVALKGTFFFTYSEPVFGLPAPWPLTLCLLSGALYLLLVFVLWPLMRPTSEKAISAFSTARFYHNVFLCLYSGGCCGATAYFMHTQDEINFFKVGLQPILCNVNMPDWLYYLNLTFIVSKVYEWVDTFFLVVLTRRGPTAALSFLHVYHHATTFWLFLCVANFESTAKTAMLLNGFVHFMMYWHYAKAWPKALVPFITMAQIAQLAFVTYIWHMTATTCGVYSLFRVRHPLEWVTPYFMGPVYLLFFIKIFVQRFVLGGGKKSSAKKDGTGAPKEKRA